MKLRIRPHPQKRKIEVIDLHEKEVPLFINKLYSTLNKPDVCASCGKKSEFLRVLIEDSTKVKILKLCTFCLHKSI